MKKFIYSILLAFTISTAISCTDEEVLPQQVDNTGNGGGIGTPNEGKL